MAESSSMALQPAGAYPVHFTADRPERFTRVQLFVRVLAFVALGLVGLSFGTIFAFAYVALPLYAAIRIASLGSSDSYAREDGPRVVRVLHWFAAVSAWVGLVADRLPARRPDETVSLVLEDHGAPRLTAGAAALRILTGLPSAFALAILGLVGTIVWFVAALSILMNERVGAGLFDYLVGLQRWSVRLLAYQGGLVEAYPPFSFAEAAPRLPAASAPA